MWRARISILGSMAIVAGLFLGLCLSRFQISPSSGPSLSLVPLPHRDNPYMHLGYEALTAGRFAQARAHFKAELRLNPNYWHGYVGLALTSSRLGQYEEARRLWGQAIKLCETARIHSRDLPSLYVSRAREAIAQSRESPAEADRLCGLAEADLATARAKIEGIDPTSVERVETAMAELEERLAEIAADSGDQQAATAHRASASSHAQAARLVDRSHSKGMMRLVPGTRNAASALESNQ